MPELPDVEIFKKEAGKAKNAKVKSTEVKGTKVLNVSQSELKSFLEDKKIEDISRRGKHLFLKVGKNQALVMHFGMTGELQYAKNGDNAPDYAQCVFNMENEDALYYISKRKLGRIDVAEDIDEYIKKSGLGPDAMQISKEEFLEKLKNSNSGIKSFLMDQSLISGIGNIYSDEILFQSKLNPRFKAKKLSSQQAEELYDQMMHVLETAIEKQADVSRFPDSFLLPHRKEGNKCPRCNGEIQKISVSGRTGYYCPDCQQSNQ